MNFSNSDKRVSLIIGLASMSVCLCSITTASLWGDEGIRISYTLNGSIHESIRGGFEQCQLLYILLEWLWSSIFGHSEIAFRSLNIPFILLAMHYMAKILHNQGLPPPYSLLLLLHPMVIYYLNDCSPYCMILAYASGILYHTFYAREKGTWKAIILTNLYLLLGLATHFLFGFFSIAYAIALIGKIRERGLRSIKRDAIVICCILIPYCLLTLKYAQTLTYGAERGWDHPGLSNIAYSIYGLLGYQGLGLSRNDLRAGLYDHLTHGMIIQLTLYTAVLLILIAINRKKLTKTIKNGTFLALGSYALIFFAAAWVKHFQFWERHVIALLPGIIIIEANLLHHTLHSTKTNRFLSAFLIAMPLLSSWHLRMNPYYWKDDYKGVATYLHEQADSSDQSIILAQGFPFMWSYYGFGLKNHPQQTHQKRSIYSIGYLPDQKLPDLCRQLSYGYSSLYLVLCEKPCIQGGGYTLFTCC